jgi:aerobic carbon-monoxide dehydrogenase large subunit
MSKKFIGERVKRTEDPRLISGLAHYVDDIDLPGLLHVAFVRSIYAHAHINSIKTEEALALPGVVAVFTGDDIKDTVGTVPVASHMEGLKIPYHPVLAVKKVCYVGEPIAAVVATDRYIARDGAELVEVDYDPLDPVVDPEAAVADGSPVIHEEFGTNVAFTWKLEGGDIEGAFASADRVVSQRMVNQRLAPIAMEPRGVIARYQPGEQDLTIWSSTQIPHLLRTQLAIMVRLPENRVRVITPEVGGGFGSKLNVYGEEALLGFISMKLARPVKWIETRRENFATTIHGRGQVGTIEAAVKNDGTLLGLRYTVVADIGAYHQLLTPGIPVLTGLMLSGSYKIPAIGMYMTGAFTNKVATDAYRGAGRPEATYVIERIMDIMAAELNLDPVEVRRKNFPRPDEFPFQTATGLAYDSGNYVIALEKAIEVADYKGLREYQKREQANGKLIGIGVSTYVEICALGPSSAMPAGGWESATVRIEPTGKVTVLTGVSPHGQGEETTFAQIVADELGVPMEDVLIVHGDTSIVQYGIGTFGSRGTAVGGTAMVMAIAKLKEKAKHIAAHLLKASDSEVFFKDGVFSVNGNSVTLPEIALAAHIAKELPPGTEPGLSATYFFEPTNFTFPFGAHIAVAEIDRDTGDVKLLRYIAVDDCGRVINPMIVEGQVHGGIVQAMGQVLYEEVVYDEGGQLITGTLMDYALPRAQHCPWFELDRTETPSPVNPLGVKGVGEAGTIGATPAITNAVIDALKHLGVRHADMPLRPEKVWRLIAEGGGK